MRRFLFALLFCVVAWAQPSVTWTQVSSIPGMGWTSLRPDPVSGGVIVPTKPTGSSSKWVQMFYVYKPDGTTSIVPGGTPFMMDTCGVDLPSPNYANPVGFPNRPGDRHTNGQAVLDTKRNIYWLWGGVNQPCSANVVTVTGSTVEITGSSAEWDWSGAWVGDKVEIEGTSCTAVAPCTIASVQDYNTLTLTTSPGNVVNQHLRSLDYGNGRRGIREDMYYMTLNANPANNVWTRVYPSATPITLNGLSYGYQGTLVYDAEDDILFHFEGFKMWSYCPTIGNSPAGLSAAQTAAGCNGSNTDNWREEAAGGHGFWYPGTVYDSNRKIIWNYGGGGGPGSNVLKAYNPGGSTRFGIPSHTWQTFCGAGCTPPPVEDDGSVTIISHTGATAYNSLRDTLMYHMSRLYAGHAHNPSDYEYNPATDRWTQLTSNGGPKGGDTANGAAITYNPSNNKLYAIGVDGLWEGAISGTGTFSTTLTLQEATFDADHTGRTTNINSGGVARSNEPFCMGVPIADSAALTSTSSLTLTGASSGQFRILGRWPSNNAKWVKVCGIIPSMAAGSLPTVTFSNSSAGNVSCGTTSLPNGNDTTCTGYGGSNLATDNGATITVATGAATFTVKKANFNVIDSVVIGGTTVVASSTAETRGLIITGPNPAAGTTRGKVTCTGDHADGTACTTIYSSANDASSTCAVEENGPVAAVLRCRGTHKSATAAPYMQYTARLTFYKGKTGVKTAVTLRNANYNNDTAGGGGTSTDCAYNGNTCAGGTFNTAHKGMKSYELRIDPNITGTLNYTIADNDATPLTGTLDGADEAFIFQGYSHWMLKYGVESFPCDDRGNQPGHTGLTPCIDQYTSYKGWYAHKNAIAIGSGDKTQRLGGWADIRNASGVGMEIGIDQMSGMWPASLEFTGGGADVRIGMLSARNTRNIYMAFPTWKSFDLFLNFHNTALASAEQDFLRYQHPILVRPPRTYTNNTGVFPYTLIDPAREDAYMLQAYNDANPKATTNTWIQQQNFCRTALNVTATSECTPDRSGNVNAGGSALDVGITRMYEWGVGGGLNQNEARWGDVLKFYQRGHSGRFISSKYFYRYVGDLYGFHHDGVNSTDSTVNGYNWRSKIHYQVETNNNGVANFWNVDTPRSLNQGLQINGYSNGNYTGRDYLHDHWYGEGDFYFVTGDEYHKEAIEKQKDWYLDTGIAIQWGYGSNAHGQPSNFMGITRAEGIALLSSARFYEYLKAVGDADANAVLAFGERHFDLFIDHPVCSGGIRPGQSTPTYYPLGCVQPSMQSYVAFSDSVGISPERGYHEFNRGTAWCPKSINDASNLSGWTGDVRITQPFMQAIMIEGLMEFRRVKGPTWNYYNRIGDLAYGLSLNNILENFHDNGSTDWLDTNVIDSRSFYNGMIQMRPIDFAAVCPTSVTLDDPRLVGPVTGVSGYLEGRMYDENSLPQGGNTLYSTFRPLYEIVGDNNWERKFKIVLQRESIGLSAWPNDFFYPVSNLINAIDNPSPKSLQPVSFSMVDVGSGNYDLTFTTPADACTNSPSCVRVKWSNKILRPFNELLGFDSQNTHQFTYDPHVYATWFASNNVWPEPTATPGVQQTFRVNTGGTPGLTAANFAVHAMTAQGGACLITTGTLPNGTVGVAYSQTLAQVNCTGTWTVTSGTLCSGLSLSGAGAITGTPDTAQTCNFTVGIGSAPTNDTQALSITIDAAPVGPEATNTRVRGVPGRYSAR